MANLANWPSGVSNCCFIINQKCVFAHIKAPTLRFTRYYCRIMKSPRDSNSIYAPRRPFMDWHWFNTASPRSPPGFKASTGWHWHRRPSRPPSPRRKAFCTYFGASRLQSPNLIWFRRLSGLEISGNRRHRSDGWEQKAGDMGRESRHLKKFSFLLYYFYLLVYLKKYGSLI